MPVSHARAAVVTSTDGKEAGEVPGLLEVLAQVPDPRKRLGDVPAIMTAQSGVFGLSQGVTVDEADKIVMPITPRLIIAIGPPNGSRTIDDAEVESYNGMQVREARDYVLHRPGANLAASIAAWRT